LILATPVAASSISIDKAPERDNAEALDDDLDRDDLFEAADGVEADLLEVSDAD
jgi:hypothetical protein